MKNVNKLLSQPVNKPDRIKTSFNIDRKLFEGFRSLCEERGISQSDLLEAMLADLSSQYQSKPEAKKRGRPSVG